MTTLPDVSGFGLIVWGIVILLLLILVTVIFLVVYSGVFEHVRIDAGASPFKDLTVAYKYVQGPYADCPEHCTELYNKTTTGYRHLAIFYDDPKVTPSDRTRYMVATILGEGDEVVSDEVKNEMKEQGCSIFNIPAASHCLRTSFPYNTQLSLYLAVKRVYPALDTYIKEHRLCAHPMIELYGAKKIQFVCPLSRQDDYYVPEFSPDENKDAADLQDESMNSASFSDSSSSVEDSTAVDDSAVGESASAEKDVPAEAAQPPSPPEQAAPPTEAAGAPSDEPSTSPEPAADSPAQPSTTPEPARTPSDTGSEQSASSFEDLASEARQMEKESPVTEEKPTEAKSETDLPTEEVAKPFLTDAPADGATTSDIKDLESRPED